MLDGRSEDYREHTIFVTLHESGSEPGKWTGSYRVGKDGEVVASASVVNTYETADEGRQNIFRIAKQRVDELIDV